MITRQQSAPKTIIGRKTLVDLPDFDMRGLIAKTDTGAYKNALHCSSIEVIRVGKRDYLSFKLLDPQHELYSDKLITVRNFAKTRVVNSFGQSQTRYVISTRLQLPGNADQFEAEFTLANRSQLKAPILLGRKFLRHRYVVDVSQAVYPITKGSTI